MAIQFPNLFKILVRMCIKKIRYLKIKKKHMTLSPRTRKWQLGKTLSIAFSQTINYIPNTAPKCAVGNICDNVEFWQNFTKAASWSTQLNLWYCQSKNLANDFMGIPPLELLQIDGGRFTRLRL